MMAILVWGPPVRALIEIGGPEPVHDAGWPDGAVDVANLPSRFAFWDGPPFGGGLSHFLYRGDTDDFNLALAAFAKVRAPALELVIHDGPDADALVKSEKDDGRVDWTFTVWVPASFHGLFNNPKSVFDADQPGFRKPVDPPRIDVYVGAAPGTPGTPGAPGTPAGPAAPGAIDWAKVKVPEGVRVTDERIEAQKVQPVGGAMIRGAIYDMATGKTIAGANVEAQKCDDKGQWHHGGTAQTDDAGAFQVEKLPAGRYRLVASGQGYAPRVLFQYVDLTAKTYKHVDGELCAEVRVAGAVTGPEGQPLAGVRVRADCALGIDGRGYIPPEVVQATTDEAGKFTLSGLPTGFAQFYCSADGLHQAEVFRIYDLAAKGFIEDNQGDVRLTARDQPVQLRMLATGAIHCQAVSPDGGPLSGQVHVRVDDADNPNAIGTWGGSAQVNPDGAADFKDVPPGKYRLTTKGPYTNDPDAKVITVTAGHTAEVEIVHR
jgi:hypothetical protein